MLECTCENRRIYPNNWNPECPIDGHREMAVRKGKGMSEQFICEKGHSMGISKGDNFCFLCGSKVNVVNPECTCGRKLSTKDVYCPSCGIKIP